jgi:hypothetical protein
MIPCELTRVRLEAIGADSSEVALFLTEQAGKIRGESGGDWEEEDPGIHTLPGTGGRTWGRLTIRRKT